MNDQEFFKLVVKQIITREIFPTHDHQWVCRIDNQHLSIKENHVATIVLNDLQDQLNLTRSQASKRIKECLKFCKERAVIACNLRQTNIDGQL